MIKDTKYFMSLNYDVRLVPIPESEGGGYEAYIPLLGRYTLVGDGRTKEEALTDLESEKAETFESLLEAGVTIPEPREKKEEYSGRILIRVAPYAHKALAEQAADQGISLNLHISTILASGFPVSEMKQALKDMRDLWSSAIYRYELHEELHEPSAPAKGFPVHQWAA